MMLLASLRLVRKTDARFPSSPWASFSSLQNPPTSGRELFSPLFESFDKDPMLNVA